MKIAYFLNTFNSINWGSQATSNGLKHLVNKHYPNADFIPINLPPLPFRKIKILQILFKEEIINLILNDDIEGLYKHLRKLGIKKDFFDNFTHICFNGEGAIHSSSGHIPLLMALLYIAKKQSIYIASINQSIDFTKDDKMLPLLCKVYSMVDFLSVRESESFKYAQKIGLNKVKLLPDGAYALDKLDKKSINTICLNYELPKKYICLTGSSILKRNITSKKKMQNIVNYAKEIFNLPIVFLANAKTDIYLAKTLSKQNDFITIQPPTKYKEAMAIIANSTCLIGGRQHPNIFSFIYKTPYIPLEANTMKNLGVAKLQNYPLNPLSWDCKKEDLQKAWQKIKDDKSLFFDINIEKFDIFKKDT